MTVWLSPHSTKLHMAPERCVTVKPISREMRSRSFCGHGVYHLLRRILHCLFINKKKWICSAYTRT